MRIQSRMSLGVVLLLSCSAAALAEPIRVLVNREKVFFPDQEPVNVANHVLVPLRPVLETMGAKVQWATDDETVIATRGRSRVTLQVGTRNATVNSRPVTLEVPAQMIGGRVMVPLRFVSESLGADVIWKDDTQTVTISI